MFRGNSARGFWSLGGKGEFSWAVGSSRGNGGTFSESGDGSFGEERKIGGGRRRAATEMGRPLSHGVMDGRKFYCVGTAHL
jgi:hypothetical protein